MKYFMSKDGGKSWIGDSPSPNMLIGQIPRYNKKKKYSSENVSVFARFDPNEAPVIGSNSAPVIPSLFTLDVLNFSGESNADVKKWTDGCKKQADRDISKFWGYTVDLNYFPETPVANHAYMGIFNDSDQAGVLGWHDEGPNSEPLIKIFTKESKRFNLSPSGTISHEIAESIGDPNASTVVRGYDEAGKNCLYFYENADPVEAFLYEIDGVEVSDFVTPAWFVQPANGPYDFLGKATKSFQICDGGYMYLSYDGGKTWTEVDKFSKLAARHRTENSRYTLYKKPTQERKKSTFTTSH